MLNGLFASLYGETITLSAFLTTACVSLILGFLISLIHRKTTDGSGTMGIALTYLPFLIHLVILLVNGNLGAGVAVAGAFSLVRFRSAPGSAKDIVTIFLAMTAGLACGMGYVALAVLAVVVVGGLSLLQSLTFSASDTGNRELRITIPENLDYAELFTDLFRKYTTRSALVQVKTVNMGSLYCLHYQIRLKNIRREKELIDQMRCRNGNLEISCGLVSSGKEGRESL